MSFSRELLNFEGHNIIYLSVSFHICIYKERPIEISFSRELLTFACHHMYIFIRLFSYMYLRKETKVTYSSELLTFECYQERIRKEQEYQRHEKARERQRKETLVKENMSWPDNRAVCVHVCVCVCACVCVCVRVCQKRPVHVKRDFC